MQRRWAHGGVLKVIQTFRETEEAASSGTGPIGFALGSGARWCTLLTLRLTEALSRARPARPAGPRAPRTVRRRAPRRVRAVCDACTPSPRVWLARLSSLAVRALPAEGEAPRGVALNDEEADLVRADALGVALAVGAPERRDAAARLRRVLLAEDVQRLLDAVRELLAAVASCRRPAERRGPGR